ncbi:MAG TPA: hypothetical protein VK543_09970, partial [Puia sp.]|nr:hypothetical protein [Puia sp.]
MNKTFHIVVKWICCLVMLHVSCLSNAQSKTSVIDSVAAKIDQYAKANPSATLFVHFDKTVYSNFENVWFQAYLLYSGVSTDSINTLSVFLIKNNDRTIWAENQFVMQNGLASGNMFLPDSLSPGNFSFVAYTNHIVNGYPDDVFIQPVTIKTIQGDVALSLNLVHADAVNNNAEEVLLKAYTKDYKGLKKAKFTYDIGSNGPTYTGATNKLGESSFSLPDKDITPGNNLLHVELKNGVLFNNAVFALPVREQKAEVKFYPEGGNLVDGTPMVVGWEVKNDKGEPLQANGFLYENGHVIDTITTNADGMGRFSLTAKKEKSYTVKLLYDPSKDVEYRLPAVVPVMPVLTVLNAIANDTINIELKNAGKAAGDLWLVLHDYKTLLAAYSVRKGESGKSIKIPLSTVPKGVFTVTLLDDYKIPLAERLCFAHYEDRNLIEISSDSNEYGTREKVNLKINLTGKDGQPVDAVVSVACVQANRIETAKMVDIESYTYLIHQLVNLPQVHHP